MDRQANLKRLLRRRRHPWQSPAPVRVSPNSLPVVRRTAQRDTGGSVDHNHRARDRKSSPGPTFVLRRWMSGSSHIEQRNPSDPPRSYIPKECNRHAIARKFVINTIHLGWPERTSLLPCRWCRFVDTRRECRLSGNQGEITHSAVVRNPIPGP